LALLVNLWVKKLKDEHQSPKFCFCTNINLEEKDAHQNIIEQYRKVFIICL